MSVQRRSEDIHYHKLRTLNSCDQIRVVYFTNKKTCLVFLEHYMLTGSCFSFINVWFSIFYLTVQYITPQEQSLEGPVQKVVIIIRLNWPALYPGIGVNAL